jgi:pimeloyl-ACP methyl ester carboxylesterase
MVFLHGLFGSGDNWWGLAARMTGVRVVLPDLRGHGLSPRGEITRQLMWGVVGLMVFIGAADFIYAFISLENKMKMTKTAAAG